MTDAFLATVVSYVKSTNIAIVKPLIIEPDGTLHPAVNASPIAGITPSPDDIVAVVTLRNNLNDKPISRVYGASETNGRIVDVVKPKNGVFTFTGNYKFIGDVVFKGDVEVTGDVTFDQDLTVTGELEVDGAANFLSTLMVALQLTVGGNLALGGSIVPAIPGNPIVIPGDVNIAGILKVNGIPVNVHKHISGSPGLPGGPMQ